jgi:hypothetical protein
LVAEDKVGKKKAVYEKKITAESKENPKAELNIYTKAGSYLYVMHSCSHIIYLLR